MRVYQIMVYCSTCLNCSLTFGEFDGARYHKQNYEPGKIVHSGFEDVDPKTIIQNLSDS